jgi:hypothetical protein
VCSVTKYLGWTNTRVLIAKVEVKRDMCIWLELRHDLAWLLWATCRLIPTMRHTQKNKK